jgi:NADH-quinone oxidoreductase subunit G
MPDVTITVDGKKITTSANSLLIEVCKKSGIEIPSFCYYPGLSLQGACRMCLVEIARMPKLQTACTTTVMDGMVVTTNSPVVKQARKAMLEFVLQNHPLDCPVCDAGGQCELQDATLTCGASESKLIDFKNHRNEEQWSPVVFFDRPRCIMCYRCVRVCGEGMDVWAFGIANRNSSQLIVPNKDGYLECEECGMCIDICPVGALTSGIYRYKTRPWEMKHVATTCTHCGDGCTTTLGVRPVENRMQIMRGSNRDKSGINGDFLCIKGRYSFDFLYHPERLKEPLIRCDGKLRSASWAEALSLVAKRFKEFRTISNAIGVIGSNHTTNEDNYLLQKLARLVLNTNSIDHHRTADYPAFFRAIADRPSATASMSEILGVPAILLIGNDPTYQHPLLAWQIRNNVRLHNSRLYVINARKIKLTRQAARFVQVPMGSAGEAVGFLADGRLSERLETIRQPLTTLAERLRTETSLIIIFGSELQGKEIDELVAFGGTIPDCKFICLGDDANSRGAADMGLYPDLLPGYISLNDRVRFPGSWGTVAPQDPGINLIEMLDAAGRRELNVLYVVGSNPVKHYEVDPATLRDSFLVVQDLFLTETAALANVVLPVAAAYEKSGTFTNTCGDLQRVHKAADSPGVKTDLEIILRIAQKMGYEFPEFVGGNDPGDRADFGQSRGAQSGEADQQAVWLTERNLEPRVSAFEPEAVLREIQRVVPGYSFPHVSVSATRNPAARDGINLVRAFHDDLFSSGTLGRYSSILNSLLEQRLTLPYEEKSDDDFAA